MSITLNQIINVNNYIIAQSINQNQFSPINKINFLLNEMIEINKLYENNILFDNYQNLYPILPFYNSYLTSNQIDDKNLNFFNLKTLNNNNKNDQKSKNENILNVKIINEKTNEKIENTKNKNQNTINEGIEFKTIIKNMEKFYLCNYKGCSNLYRSKENLVLHYKNKHLKEKPYRCSYCKATFSHRNGKTYHERKVHTLIFPHKCSFLNCDMKFASKSALNYHLKHQH